MKIHQSLLVFMLATQTLVSAQAQDYQDYGDYDQSGGDYYYGQEAQTDTLYQDYAEGKVAGGGGGGGGLVKSFAFGLTGWFLGGKIHSGRAVKKAQAKAKKDLKDLYTKYIADVSALSAQNQELEQYIKQMVKQQLTEEFLMADIDNNRLVSRAEFEMHKKNYLIKHPEMDGSAFPAFEEFDPDGNGMISIREHEKYYEDRGMI